MTEVKKTDSWQERGVALAQEHRLRQFAIADWLVEGIDLNGATVTYDAAETLFPQYHRATFLSWVKKVTLRRRNERNVCKLR